MYRQCKDSCGNLGFHGYSLKITIIILHCNKQHTQTCGKIQVCSAQCGFTGSFTLPWRLCRVKIHRRCHTCFIFPSRVYPAFQKNTNSEIDKKVGQVLKLEEGSPGEIIWHLSMGAIA
jgi:hypothetical protein